MWRRKPCTSSSLCPAAKGTNQTGETVVKDASLADINFREILDYGGQPRVENAYSTPPVCRGYCISCEESGLLEKTGGRLDLMSHGCDSADFEDVLGPMSHDRPGLAEPVLFLLENPGGDYGNGAPIDFRGLRKQPPVNVYYWTPNIQIWPRGVADFRGNFYGPYFAYLMQRHQLLNVYITNLVKCKWVKSPGERGGNGDASLIVNHCVERYLTREVQLFAPRIAFCFGKVAERGFRDLSRRIVLKCPFVNLLHPSFIQFRSQTVRRSQDELVQENDERVRRGIAQLA